MVPTRPAALLCAVTLALVAAPMASAQASGRIEHPSSHTIVALTPRDPAGLAHEASAIADPSSPLYRRYLTVAQFRARFGASPQSVRRLRRTLTARGLHAGPLAANGLELTVSSDLGRERTDAVSAAGATASSSTVQTLATGVDASLIQSVVGSSRPGPTSSGVVRPVAHGTTEASLATHGPSARAAVGSTGQACTDAAQTASAGGAYTAPQIAGAYGMSPAADDNGSGVTIALYEMEPFSSADLAADEACYGGSGQVSVVPVDGGAGQGAGSGESAMDLATLIGLAPDARILVYEGPDTGLGAYDTYSRIISQDSAQIVSTSWGQCEALEGRDAAQAEQTLFEEAALQGQTVVAASGDDGSDDCGYGGGAVDDPASQPWVTGVGATSLADGANSVWNNSLGASGGGVSKFWARPSYQSALTPAAGGCDAATGCREVPDISIDGDPDTGYVASYDGSWVIVGGTSVAAPAIAALTALSESSPACGGRRIGFLNPLLYQLPSSALTDVTVGENGYDGVAGFAATTGYDAASGLGVPSSGFASALCAAAGQSSAAAAAKSALAQSQAIHLRRQPNRNDRVGQRVHLKLVAKHPNGASVRFTATGLPRGLTLDRGNGVIEGRPRAAGTHVVRLRVSGDKLAAASTTFHWTISRRAANGPSARRDARAARSRRA